MSLIYSFFKAAVNNLRWPLFVMLAVDDCGHGVPISYMFSSNERTATVQLFIEVMHKTIPQFRPALYIIDKCSAEIGAIKNWYGSVGMYSDNVESITDNKSTFRICYFHIKQAWDR
jgi:hypothetical protein